MVSVSEKVSQESENTSAQPGRRWKDKSLDQQWNYVQSKIKMYK